MSEENPTPAATGIRVSIPAAIAFAATAALVGAGAALTVQHVDAQSFEKPDTAVATPESTLEPGSTTESGEADGWQVYPPEEPLSLDTWNPFQEMQAMHERMDKLFNDSWMRFHRSPLRGSLNSPLTESPRIDMTESETEYVVHVDMPGLDQANANVTLEDNLLTISGTRVDTVEDAQGGQILRQERRASQFMRTMTLPGPVDSAGMATAYDNGVLTVRIPKLQQEAQPPITNGPIQ